MQLQHLRRLIVSPQRLAWVLWLALLLPMGQAAGSWHAISHLHVEAGEAGKQSLHQSHCDLDLTVATVQGGAPAGVPAVLALLPAAHAAPLESARSVWVAPPARAYESRAPPLALS